MSIAYSFSASFRWTPRYDFGEVASVHFVPPDLGMEFDPFFLWDETLVDFSIKPSLSMLSVIVKLGELAEESSGAVFDSVPAVSVLSVIKPIGSIASEGASGVFSSVPIFAMKEVLNPVGLLSEETTSASFAQKVNLHLAPP